MPAAFNPTSNASRASTHDANQRVGSSDSACVSQLRSQSGIASKLPPRPYVPLASAEIFSGIRRR
jgi:hypothetical protein